MTALAAVVVLLAQLPSPEECLVRPGQQAVASASFNGRTYHFAQAACRDVFLSDPERYAQLYDALSELAAEGRAPDEPRDASLVPS